MVRKSKKKKTNCFLDVEVLLCELDLHRTSSFLQQVGLLYIIHRKINRLKKPGRTKNCLSNSTELKFALLSSDFFTGDFPDFKPSLVKGILDLIQNYKRKCFIHKL